MKMNYKIDNKFIQKTIREYLLSFHLAKAKIYNLFLEKRIYLNGELATENTKIIKNSVLSIIYDEKINYIPYKYELEILYEDDYLLIINKPPFFMVHPDEENKDKTVANMVAYYYLKKNISTNVRYVHRLDTETTGILVFAKDMLTESYMNYNFMQHSFKRYYLAICSGEVKPDEGTIDAPIGLDRHHNQRRRVSKTGQNAITHYKVLKYYKHFSLVEMLLETGRTHQIRVHMKYLGYPLLGDELYGGSIKKIKRVALHSARFVFYHPFLEEEITINCLLPFDMKKVLE